MKVHLIVISALAVSCCAAIECVNNFVPSETAWALNKVNNGSDVPLFRLTFSEVNSNEWREGEPLKYRVIVTTENRPFDYAKVMITANDSCGLGLLHFDQGDFLQIRQQNQTDCPTILITSKAAPLTELPLLVWSQPPCGCVEFKVLIGIGRLFHFADHSDDTNKALTKTGCVQMGGNWLSHLQTLCYIYNRIPNPSILARPQFLTRYRLYIDPAEINYTNYRSAPLLLIDLKWNYWTCCSKEIHRAKINCFAIIRMHRIDRTCGETITVTNVTYYTTSFMRDRERQCCTRLGVGRYECFNVGSEITPETRSGSLIYSHDETDPANDLPIFYWPEDRRIPEKLAYVQFRN